MPYRRRFRRRRRTTPRTAAKKVQRNARYRRSSKSQSRQIVRLARSVSNIQHELKDDELHATYRMNVCFRCIPHSEQLNPPQKRNGIVIVPLTSGPSAVNPADPTYPSATGNFSDGGGTLNYGNCKWQPWVRPRSASAVNWMKLYNQTVKVRLESDQMDAPVTYQIFLLRVARKNHTETNSHGTIMQLAQRIDGTKFIGNGSLTPDTGFQRNNDYVSSVALKYTPASGTGVGNTFDTDDGTITGDPEGAGNDVMFNSNYYETVAKRTVKLGPQPNPLYEASLASLTQPKLTPASQPANNCMSKELTFKINYGGTKLSAVDGSGPSAVDQIQDIHYDNLNPKLKHWLVICPNVGTPVSNALCSINSVITCKVPA